MGSSGESPLEQLAATSGWDFPNLLGARKRTAEGLATRRPRLAGLPHDSDTSVVLMGSWGRAEVTRESDDDFMVLVGRGQRTDVSPSIEAVQEVLDRPPGEAGIFGEPVFCDELVRNIGLDRDDNKNLTRRMLFLLESAAVTGENVYLAAREKVLRQYLDESIKDFRPPRFLLNDTVRYWRTICVDFAGKERAGSDKWGIRNAKLRTSRKVLFASGLLPILDCSGIERDSMYEFLMTQFDMSPTDRIARAFMQHGAVDEGGRALGAYDEFLGLLDDEDFRRQLRDVTRSAAGDSAAFSEARRLGRELQAGLLALLFETESLPKLVREYAIF